MNLYPFVAVAVACVLLLAVFNFILRRKVANATRRIKEYHRRVMFLNQSVGMLMGSSNITVYVYDMKYKRLQTLVDGKICDCPIKYLSEFENTMGPDEYKKYLEIREKLLSGVLNEASFSLNRVSRVDGRPFCGEYNISVKDDERGHRRFLICLEKDETEHRRMLQKQSEIITSLDLALSSANLISWKYNVVTEQYGMMDSRLNKYKLTRDEWHSMMSKEECEYFVNFVNSVIEDDSRPNMIKLHLQLPGDVEPQLYELTVTVRANDKHEPTYLYGILNNISTINNYKTRIGKLEENIRLALLAGNLAVWSYDIEKRRVHVFHTYDGDDLDISKDELYAAVHPDDHNVLKAAVEGIKNNKITSSTFRLRFGKPGSWRWYDCSFILNDDKRYVTGLRKDVTAMVRRTELLSRRTAELQLKQDELMSLNDKNKKMLEEMTVAKHRAEESDRMKSSFISNMSHEIRTPLNAIVGFSELLQYNTQPEERQEYINIINSNNQLLIRMVNDVLDLSRIESGTVKLEYDTFDAVLVLGEIYETFLMKHSKENVDLVYESKFATCNVTLDHNRFYQVVTNFLTNAIKYTPSGRVTLALDEVDGVVRVSVKDTGIGIAKDKHKLVFQRFEKLDSFAPGSGLGLSICKAIVEAMGGTIGFESEKDKGSTFWACFPYNVTTSVTRNDNDMIEEQAEELTE